MFDGLGNANVSRLARAVSAAIIVIGLLAMGGEARADGAVDPKLTLTGRDADSPGDETYVRQGGTAQWVAAYDDSPGASSNVRIDHAFSGGQAVVAGSVRAPEGWRVSTSTDGGASYGGEPPGPATTNVRAEGMLAPGGRGAVASLPKPVESMQSGGATRGDGWVPILYKNRSYNVYHHKQPGPSGHVMCFDRSTGSPCPGYPARISSVKGPSGTGPDDMASVGSAQRLCRRQRQVRPARRHVLPGTT